MKTIILFFILFFILFSVTSFASDESMTIEERRSLTYFSNPFLIGDWYFFKPAHVENDYDVLHISLSSNNQFRIEMIEMASNTAEEWEGSFEISQDSIRFKGNEDESQIYHYQVSHNRLYLNGVEFFKVVPERIIGSWNSELVSGEDIMVSNVKSLNLKLRSDFIFSLEVISHTGQSNHHIGYYYFENNDLVLLYEEGEQESTFHITEDLLEIKNEQFGMYALLVRQ
ncbi:hypothetical protein PVK64_15420 [Aliivibrio sp. S4TY2]|uniref:hypothetical protein n=1 Tax=unclassified Aliivibrio TaxID=2645654 RepID=UPI002379A845|nr:MULTISPECIES: hypothetical protein [unclassified Aliivibrio]MDD9157560.1 hypothetical protein [Aliivibrio sp. S4TY2]MDD9161477.1 hypothetical protein [Aliivibrio sp. S4TY1]MDD9165470.1 hypothetical protein [Aliivibrio sp. S4MY2]MDD9169506.1 hypothetical protein [Aliivibrio sp. S4MY4]MDD9186499.1 hypothetical protein [Aliivibrio sp. S4MY3]